MPYSRTQHGHSHSLGGSNSGPLDSEFDALPPVHHASFKSVESNYQSGNNILQIILICGQVFHRQVYYYILSHTCIDFIHVGCLWITSVQSVHAYKSISAIMLS